jgi:hypothetical protein
MAGHLLLERLANELGHRRAPFGCHGSKAVEEVLGE